MFDLTVPDLLRLIPAILLALTVHELSHAGVALLLGDDTPRAQGRLTLNPLKHIDPVGFIVLLIAGFGWAKPVVIDREKLRRPRLYDTLIALAGPAANLLLAVLLLLMLHALLFPPHDIFTKLPEKILNAVMLGYFTFLYINIALAVFNLLPIPPLDGSHLITNLLSLKSPAISETFYRYGSLTLLAVIVLDRFTGVDILPLGRMVNAVYMFLLKLFALA